MSDASNQQNPNPQMRFTHFLTKFLAVVPRRQAALRTIAFQFAQDCAMKKLEVAATSTNVSSTAGTATALPPTGLLGFGSSFGFAGTKEKEDGVDGSDGHESDRMNRSCGRKDSEKSLEAALEELYDKAMADIRQCVGVAFYAHVVDGSGGSLKKPIKSRAEAWPQDKDEVANGTPGRKEQVFGASPALPQKLPPAAEFAASISAPLVSPRKKIRSEPSVDNESMSTTGAPSEDANSAVSIDKHSATAFSSAKTVTMSKHSGIDDEDADDGDDIGTVDGTFEGGDDNSGEDDSVAVVKVKGRGGGAVLEVVEESHNDFFIARAVKKPPRDAVCSQVVGDRLLCPEEIQHQIQSAEAQMNANYMSLQYASAEAALAAMGVNEAGAGENGRRSNSAVDGAREEACSDRPPLHCEIGSTATALQLKRFFRMNQPYDRAAWLVPFRHCSKLRKLISSGGRNALLEFQLSRGRENCATLLNLALQRFVTDIVECAVDFSKKCASGGAVSAECLRSRSESGLTDSEYEPRKRQVTVAQLVASLRERHVYCRHRAVGDLLSGCGSRSHTRDFVLLGPERAHDSDSGCEGGSDEGENRRGPHGDVCSSGDIVPTTAPCDIAVQKANVEQGRKYAQGRVLPSQLNIAQHMLPQEVRVAPSPRVADAGLSPMLLDLSTPTSVGIGSPDGNALMAFLARSPAGINSSPSDTPRL